MPPERIEIHAVPRGIGDWWIAKVVIPELRMTVTRTLCVEGESAALAEARRMAEALDPPAWPPFALPPGWVAARWVPEPS